MSSYAFEIWSFIYLVVLLGLAALIGNRAGLGLLGILIDSRGRYSLTHFQVVLWTIVILSTMLGMLSSLGFNTQNFQIPSQLLGLMGISAGSAVAATAVKATKDIPGSQTNVARPGIEFKQSDNTTRSITAKLAQIWLEEEGDHADKVISITKFQNFIFTLVILGIYVTAACKSNGLPTLPDNVVWLMGISHAGYVGGKVPDKR